MFQPRIEIAPKAAYQPQYHRIVVENVRQQDQPDCASKLNRRLRKLDEAAERLRVVSDSVGESLAEGTIAVKKRNEAFRAALREHKPGFGERRLLKAFPDIRSERYAEAMQELKRRLLGENKDAKAAEAAQRNAEQAAENKD